MSITDLKNAFAAGQTTNQNNFESLIEANNQEYLMNGLPTIFNAPLPKNTATTTWTGTDQTQVAVFRCGNILTIVIEAFLSETTGSGDDFFIDTTQPWITTTQIPELADYQGDALTCTLCRTVDPGASSLSGLQVGYGQDYFVTIDSTGIKFTQINNAWGGWLQGNTGIGGTIRLVLPIDSSSVTPIPLTPFEDTKVPTSSNFNDLVDVISNSVGDEGEYVIAGITDAIDISGNIVPVTLNNTDCSIKWVKSQDSIAVWLTGQMSITRNDDGTAAGGEGMRIKLGTSDDMPWLLDLSTHINGSHVTTFYPLYFESGGHTITASMDGCVAYISGNGVEIVCSDTVTIDPVNYEGYSFFTILPLIQHTPEGLDVNLKAAIANDPTNYLTGANMSTLIDKSDKTISEVQSWVIDALPNTQLKMIKSGNTYNFWLLGTILSSNLMYPSQTIPLISASDLPALANYQGDPLYKQLQIQNPTTSDIGLLQINIDSTGISVTTPGYTVDPGEVFTANGLFGLLLETEDI